MGCVGGVKGMVGVDAVWLRWEARSGVKVGWVW